MNEVTGPAIIDTNVVIAGLLTTRAESPVARILDCMVAGSVPFVLSEALLAEYRQVMARPKLRNLHGLDEQAIDVIVLELAQHAIVLNPAHAPSASGAPDPGDQHLWDLLRAHDGVILVTGDLRLHGPSDLKSRVIAPKAFIEAIERPQTR